MNFEYMYVAEALDSINIEDIGQCALCATNDTGKEYYLVIKSLFGWVRIVEFGPFFVGVDQLLGEFSFTQTEIEYSMRKVANRIEKFLQNPKRQITQVREITREEALERLKGAMTLYATNFERAD